MPTGKGVLQKIRRNGDNLAVRPQIWGRDAFFASLFALKGKFMRFAYDTNKTLIPKFHEINGFIGKFGILHADYQVKLIDGQSAQIGVGLVKDKLRRNIFLRCQNRSKYFADEPVGMGIGIANAQGTSPAFVKALHPFP